MERRQTRKGERRGTKCRNGNKKRRKEEVRGNRNKEKGKRQRN